MIIVSGILWSLRWLVLVAGFWEDLMSTAWISMKLLNQGSCTVIPFSSVATRYKSSAQKRTEALHEKEMNNLIQPHAHRPSGEISHPSSTSISSLAVACECQAAYGHSRQVILVFLSWKYKFSRRKHSLLFHSRAWKGIPSGTGIPAGHMTAKWHSSCLTADDRYLSLADTPTH